ncbi:MAG: thioredoxin family protein [bacterium]|nr:thioredoxin family protein [bacterium]
MKIIKIGAVWCPGCLVMNKIWNNIKTNYPEVEIEELDYDMDSLEVLKYNSGKVLPVIIFLSSDNQELDRLIGEKKYDDISELIIKYEDK